MECLEGLFYRTEQNKAGEFISNDLNDIAKALLGDAANANDLGSLETIMAKLPPQEADALMAELEQDRNWKTESLELNRIKQLAGLSLNSVRML